MGIIWDIVKDLPTVGVLKEKILDLDAKLGALETENSILSGDLRKANIQIDNLTEENKRIKEQLNPSIEQKEQLAEVAHEILMFFGRYNDSIPNNVVTQQINGDATTITYHLTDLTERNYLENAASNRGEGGRRRLTQKGKKYVMDHSS